MVHGYTTIEQSKKLLSLGLDPSTADMCYVIDYSAYDKIGKDKYNVSVDHYGCLIHQQDNIPCWSLAALLELIPLYTLEQTTDGKVISVSEIGQYSKCSEACDSPIDAAFEIVCWLIERKHVKVNK